MSSYLQTAHSHQVKTAARFQKAHTKPHKFPVFPLCHIFLQENQTTPYQALLSLYPSFQEYQVYRRQYHQAHAQLRCEHPDIYYIRRVYIYVSFFFLLFSFLSAIIVPFKQQRAVTMIFQRCRPFALKLPCQKADTSFVKNYFSHFWLATVHDVLHADWQDA